ncbi:hypothetical protein ACFQ6Q_00150 [Streptomyces sp. NPDC056437]|uniref:hypothetical protein n=1 Tax=Streptomyces sp. NPDC056437 TaxID=3345816 RepID=UPI003684862A
MTELRLIDPLGYTVPGTLTIASAGTVTEVTAQLLNDIAPAHAEQWADFGYDARNYRVA